MYAYQRAITIYVKKKSIKKIVQRAADFAKFVQSRDPPASQMKPMLRTNLI